MCFSLSAHFIDSDIKLLKQFKNLQFGQLVKIWMDLCLINSDRSQILTEYPWEKDDLIHQI